jgi:hypothetical protein
MVIEILLLFIVIFIPLIFSNDFFNLNQSTMGRFLLIIIILALSLFRTYLGLIFIIIFICLSQVNYSSGSLDYNLNNYELQNNNNNNNKYSYDLLNIMNVLNNDAPLSNVDLDNLDENNHIEAFNDNIIESKTNYNIDNILLT